MSTSPNCFVIMPINNEATEHLWQDVYQSVISDCGFIADRIDESDDGSDLSPQILEKIVNADLIIADLTMERQNCYFELGYAYGKTDTDASVIVCCREDHSHYSDNYKKDGPQVHFDLSGRYIIWWDDEDLEKFRAQLKEKIKSRMEQITSQQEEPAIEILDKNLQPDESLKVVDEVKDELEEKLSKAIEVLEEA